MPSATEEARQLVHARDREIFVTVRPFPHSASTKGYIYHTLMLHNCICAGLHAVDEAATLGSKLASVVQRRVAAP